MRLKTFLIALSLSCMVSQSAKADLIVALFAGGGFVPNRANTGGVVDLNTGILDSSVNASGQVLVQIIATPTSTPGAALPNGGVQAGETILRSVMLGVGLPSGPSESTHGASSVYGDFSLGISYSGVDVPGFVFGRIFDAPQGQVSAGSFYYDGPTVSAVMLDPGPPPPNPQTVTMNLNTLGPGDELNLQVVPEPGALVLAGLGLVLLARRKRRTI